MYLINTDCSIEPFNPGGILAWAFIAKSIAGSNKGREWSDYGISGRGEGKTNNMGEYHAVIAALRWAIQLPQEDRRPLIIQSDSQLLVNQCSGRWRVKDEKLAPLRILVSKAIQRYGKAVTFKWVPREQNTAVDRVSRLAYDPPEIRAELEQMRASRHREVIEEMDELPW